MFSFMRKEDPDLDAAIGEAFSDLKGFTAESPEYARAVDQLVKLHNLKQKRVDPNTKATIASNLLISLAVLKYERMAVITTKVRDFLTKI